MPDKHRVLTLDVDRSVTLTWNPETGEITWGDADKGQGVASTPAPSEPYIGYLKGYQDGVRTRRQEVEAARAEGRMQADRNWARSVKNYDNQVERAKLANQRADQAEATYRATVAQLQKVTEERNSTQRRFARSLEEIALLKQRAAELATLKAQLGGSWGPGTGFLTPEELLGRLREQGNELEELRRFKVEARKFVHSLRNRVAYGGSGYLSMGGAMWPEWSVIEE